MTRDERQVRRLHTLAGDALRRLAELGESTELESSTARDALDDLAVAAAGFRDWLNGDDHAFSTDPDGRRRPKRGTYAHKVARALGVDAVGVKP